MKAELKWNNQTRKLLKELPSKIVQEIALETLNVTYPTIPMSSALVHNNNRGRLRRETVAKGVQKEGEKFYLESPSPYSPYVYNFNDTTTNWSTPGTHSEWFDRTWEKQGNAISTRVLERNKL